MGIKGLLPFVKRASRVARLEEFGGSTVAVDTYCWLHKGAFSCAEQLALNRPTDQYVNFVMKMVSRLIEAGLRPLLVFDGARLGAKSAVEMRRRENRHQYKQRAAQLLAEGRTAEARECFERCTEVTPAMALEVIRAARSVGVDCLVAPYEADAQLAWLATPDADNRVIADLVLTEDSDLIAFGVERILFKLDMGSGSVLLVERRLLPEACSLSSEQFSMTRLRHMCILAGCDYFSGVEGVGLNTAAKVMQRTRLTGLRQVAQKLNSYLPGKSAKKSKLFLDKDRLDEMELAEFTFLYQVVFDPLTRRRRRLNTPPPAVSEDVLVPIAGELMLDRPDVAWQLALGNLAPDTLLFLDKFDPDAVEWRHRKAFSFRRSLVMPPSIENHSRDATKTSSSRRNVTLDLSVLMAGNKAAPSSNEEGGGASRLVDETLLSLYHPNYKTHKALVLGSIDLTSSASNSREHASTRGKEVLVEYVKPVLKRVSCETEEVQVRRRSISIEQPLDMFETLYGKESHSNCEEQLSTEDGAELDTESQASTSNKSVMNQFAVMDAPVLKRSRFSLDSVVTSSKFFSSSAAAVVESSHYSVTARTRSSEAPTLLSPSATSVTTGCRGSLFGWFRRTDGSPAQLRRVDPPFRPPTLLTDSTTLCQSSDAVATLDADSSTKMSASDDFCSPLSVPPLPFSSELRCRDVSSSERKICNRGGSQPTRRGKMSLRGSRLRDLKENRRCESPRLDNFFSQWCASKKEMLKPNIAPLASLDDNALSL